MFLKELRETLRDPNALMTSVLFPVLLYPGLVWGANLWEEYQTGQHAGEEPAVVVVGDPDGVVARGLRGVDGLDVVERPDADAALAAGEVAAVVSATPDGAGGLAVETRWRSDRSLSDRARERVGTALDTVREQRIEADGVAHGLQPGAGTVTVTVAEEASRAQVLPWLLSMIVPLILVLNGMIAGYYPAIEAAVGERERGTLETTLVCAVPRGAVVAGKLLCVFTVAIVATIASFASLLLSVWQLLGLLKMREMFQLDIGVGTWLGVLGCAVVAALVLNAWVLLAVLRARDFKQAQNIASLFLAVGMGLGMIGSIDGFGPELGHGLIPVTNLVLVMREWIAGRAVWPWAPVALIENLVLSGVPVVIAARVVAGESWRYGSPAGRAAR